MIVSPQSANLIPVKSTILVICSTKLNPVVASSFRLLNQTEIGELNQTQKSRCFLGTAAAIDAPAQQGRTPTPPAKLSPPSLPRFEEVHDNAEGALPSFLLKPTPTQPHSTGDEAPSRSSLPPAHEA
ncbi:hypothetical protein Dimus_024471 [Dionaea muscipula]